jgi:hypothetical protein
MLAELASRSWQRSSKFKEKNVKKVFAKLSALAWAFSLCMGLVAIETLVAFGQPAQVTKYSTGKQNADQKKAEADETGTITLDVAMDASSARSGRPDWSVTGPLRGDTIVSNGLVYAGGSIPDGDTTATFSLTGDGRLGELVVRGQYVADAAEIASGAPYSTASTQIFMLDEGSGVVTEGLEGAGTTVRAVVGGFGRYSGATGQVTQEAIGFNGTGGSNLRFTFTLKVANAQAPSESMNRKARLRRR